jgi:hypothetical protein
MRTLIASLIVLIVSSTALAEDEPSEDRRPLVALNWVLGIPARGLRSELNNLSYVGFRYSMFVPLSKGLHIGVTASFNQFADHDGRQTFQRDNLAITGTYYRQWTTAAVAFAARYYLGDAEAILRAYAGLDVGVSFGTISRWVVDLGEDNSLVGLQLAPEAGLSLRIWGPLELTTSYQYVFTTQSFGVVHRPSYHALQVGPQFHY